MALALDSTSLRRLASLVALTCTMWACGGAVDRAAPAARADSDDPTSIPSPERPDAKPGDLDAETCGSANGCCDCGPDPEPPVPSCLDVAGSYFLQPSDPNEIWGENPWLWIREEGGQCTAIVATSGFPGRLYDVELANRSVRLTPHDEPALGGSENYPEPSGYHLEEWSDITLPALNEGGFEGAGQAVVAWSYSEEDIGDEGESEIDFTLLDQTGSAAMVVVPELEPWSTTAGNRRGFQHTHEAEVLPWSAAKVVAARPTSGIAQHLVLPPGFHAVDVQEAGEVGVREARVSFSGDWDSVRGQELTLTFDGMPLDLSGRPVVTRDLVLRVLDVGPAATAHDMSTTDELARFGWEISAYAANDCSGGGCLKLDAYCGDRATVAGQLALGGHTEVMVRMWTDLTAEFPDDPAFYSVVLVGDDGSRLPAKVPAVWNSETSEQIWTYDATGHSKVGFSVATTRYCHGWGGALILDEVSAR